MGLLDNINQQDYYQGQEFGDYQFVSLNDIITQFQIMYTGEDKLIPKAKRADIAFHAQRALAELSFDTFKCIKSQQIDLPPSLVMPLPIDYVNYTKLSWVDSAGIKRPLYSTKYTSNPFQVNQDSDKDYEFFSGGYSLLTNGDFSDGSNGWLGPGAYAVGTGTGGNSFVSVANNVLTFSHQQHLNDSGDLFSTAHYRSQAIDVTFVDRINLSADGTAANSVSGEHYPGTIRIGIATQVGNNNVGIGTSNFNFPHWIDGDYIEWFGTGALGAGVQSLENIDVSGYDEVYVVVISFATPMITSTQTVAAINSIDDISVVNPDFTNDLNAEPGNELNSSTWNAYKANAPSENSIDDYRYEQHWLNPNERYGLDPQHAQINGSFFIDDRLGRIHFSSNINGKTVILDYISDGLGTDAEMQVPKLAEDAMYKQILYDVLSTRSNIGGSRLAFHKREKFAAVRKAKLRLSNIKLEELTQILRGQSKIIKH